MKPTKREIERSIRDMRNALKAFHRLNDLDLLLGNWRNRAAH